MTQEHYRPRGMTFKEAFRWYELVPQGDCLLWPLAPNPAGYGVFKLRGKMYYAHIVSYELTYGPVPDDKEIDHIQCVSRACVNPAHLRAVTSKQNQENQHAARGKVKIRGISWNKYHSLWKAQMTHHGKTYSTLRKDINDAEAWLVAKRLELYTHNEDDRNPDGRKT
jgi:hypothetical protein